MLQKPLSKLIVTLIAISIVIYPLLCFSGLSFNPFEWSKFERLILGVALMAALLIFISDLYNAKTASAEKFKL